MKQSLTLESFKSHVPVWSAQINYKYKSTTLLVANTIDYGFLGLWACSKFNSGFLNRLENPPSSKSSILIEIIKDIEIKNWDKAR